MNSTVAVEWPDWRDETAIIVGTGPSAATVPLEQAKGQARVFVIKSSWRLAPWADALYGADRGWWVANQGAKQFLGLKFCPCPSICRVYKDVRLVGLKPKANILIERTGVVGCGLNVGGGHSGFQAINLAIQFGVKRIVLVGFDMVGAHWHNDYQGVAKPDAKRMRSWCVDMEACAPQFTQLGIEVLNASLKSALKAYPTGSGGYW